tara:strand:+ start:333 stop:1682 length:1350 start_codon:yes stop_codon:yes gene_type:complete
VNIAAWEVNFDGLSGPTHSYGGLSYGNIASMKNRLSASNPKAAALQGLKKMKLLHDFGIKQGILPPHERPDFNMLRRLGFAGTEAEILEKSSRADMQLLLACFSSSGMWAANAATVSPSSDTRDGRVHFTPANLVSEFHRSIEAPFTGRVLRRIFHDDRHFSHHAPIPGSLCFSDEGSANHLRLCRLYNEPGLEIFVYGREALSLGDRYPTAYPARQTREASMAVKRLHELRDDATLVTQQNPVAIDQGVFHNDVICVGDRNLLWYHADAFLDGPGTISSIRRICAEHYDIELNAIKITDRQLPIDQAVQSYIFNSQLVTLPDQSQYLIAPSRCCEIASARACINALVDDSGIQHVCYVDLEQSMLNGGGPACLRLRVVLTDEELAHVHENVILTELRYECLVGWVSRNFRDRLHIDDLADPLFLTECQKTLDELTAILDLGSLYEFQR